MTKETENLKICRSCGMPMQKEQCGTNGDGSKSNQYCRCCCQGGNSAGNSTMEEMAKFCARFEAEGGRAKALEKAEKMLLEYFATPLFARAELLRVCLRNIK